jgi:hypothetical protein
MNRKFLLPREHGAWGMLLQPFVAGALLGRTTDPLLLPALLAVLTMFVMREPLLILARQRFIWKDHHPEADAARRALLYESTLLIACGALLISGIPLLIMTALGSAAALITVLAVYMTLKNRQRSVLLQSLSALALGSSTLLSGYLGTRNIWDQRTWALWLLLSLHFLTGIFLVHARLDKRAHKLDTHHSLQISDFLIGLSVLLAVVARLFDHGELMPPLLLSAAACGVESHLVRQPTASAEPLKQVGLRALALSIMHTLVTVASLW